MKIADGLQNTWNFSSYQLFSVFTMRYQNEVVLWFTFLFLLFQWNMVDNYLTCYFGSCQCLMCYTYIRSLLRCIRVSYTKQCLLCIMYTKISKQKHNLSISWVFVKCASAKYLIAMGGINDGVRIYVSLLMHFPQFSGISRSFLSPSKWISLWIMKTTIFYCSRCVK